MLVNSPEDPTLGSIGGSTVVSMEMAPRRWKRCLYHVGHGDCGCGWTDTARLMSRTGQRRLQREVPCVHGHGHPLWRSWRRWTPARGARMGAHLLRNKRPSPRKQRPCNVSFAIPARGCGRSDHEKARTCPTLPWTAQGPSKDCRDRVRGQVSVHICFAWIRNRVEDGAGSRKNEAQKSA